MEKTKIIAFMAGAVFLAGLGSAQAQMGASSFYATNSAETNYFMGKTGVGTNNPASLLHVAGGLTVSGAMAVPKQGNVSMGSYTNGDPVLGVSGGGSNGSASFYRAVMNCSTQYNIPASTMTPALLDTVVSDNFGGVNQSSNIIVLKRLGMWKVTTITKIDLTIQDLGYRSSFLMYAPSGGAYITTNYLEGRNYYTYGGVMCLRGSACVNVTNVNAYVKPYLWLADNNPPLINYFSGANRTNSPIANGYFSAEFMGE